MVHCSHPPQCKARTGSMAATFCALWFWSDQGKGSRSTGKKNPPRLPFVSFQLICFLVCSSKLNRTQTVFSFIQTLDWFLLIYPSHRARKLGQRRSSNRQKKTFSAKLEGREKTWKRGDEMSKGAITSMTDCFFLTTDIANNYQLHPFLSPLFFLSLIFSISLLFPDFCLRSAGCP